MYATMWNLYISRIKNSLYSCIIWWFLICLFISCPRRIIIYYEQECISSYVQMPRLHTRKHKMYRNWVWRKIIPNTIVCQLGPCSLIVLYECFCAPFLSLCNRLCFRSLQDKIDRPTRSICHQINWISESLFISLFIKDCVK